MDKRSPKRPYAIFLAAPMSGFETDAAYRHHRTIINKACAFLEKEGHSVYFAGRAMTSQANFTADKTAAFQQDYNHLAGCDFFALYYPEPLRSSVLVETGMAIGLGKPCLLIAQHKSDFVYLLDQAGKASGSFGLPPISIQEFGTEKPSGPGLAAMIDEALSHIQADEMLIAS